MYILEMMKKDPASVIGLTIGGDTDNIYRMEVYNNESFTIRDLEPNGGWMNDKDGVSIENFYWD